MNSGQPSHPDIAKRKIFSVTDLTKKIKVLLENSYPFIWISGEISNYRKAISGHTYFTLKDDAAQISAVMFRGQNRKLKFAPEDGLAVMGFGRISVYEPRGTYQIILEYLEPHGIGALLAAFERLKAKLSSEGLFDDIHKRPLPHIPRRVSVITSPSGAVIRDIINVAGRRFASIPIQVTPAKVQGDGAAEEICTAIELVNGRQDCDIIVIARGGGSIEDLAPFNTERVARAIFASQIPVVSAVGHETDFTIADFTADLRAPTPSAAAELIFPDKFELQARGDRLTKALIALTKGRLEMERRTLMGISRHLIRPDRRIQSISLRLDDLAERLVHAMHNQMRQKKQVLDLITSHFSSRPLSINIKKLKEKLDELSDKILIFNNFNISTKKTKIRALTANLEALSPRAVLKRGYSILRTIPQGNVVSDSRSVEPGQNLEAILANGNLQVKVRKNLK